MDAGEHLAVVGHSGAGKSSLAGILLGWHRAAAGSVQVDGVDLDERSLATLRRHTAWVDPAIQLFWTGPEVCAREFTPGHLARVAGQLGRKPILWDNYPVNDGSRMSQHLHLRAFTGRPGSIAPYIAAHGVNPASQPMLSRIPLLTLAESYKAGEAYDYLAAFERAAREVLGEELAIRVGKDIVTLQDRGLDRLGERKAALKARYAAFDHPAAREISMWLEGYWTVTDELVQTQ